ncbi:MAG: 50S ribosomal protein L15 [Candidatus Bathyarchaeota archaeon]|nr:MAG: 50S ribosomal protein L15 [Candidatus Bathyarchaeota archaeon]UCE57776.1 MAG: 50S ribosomal protein L15 [Candidatus Bathyarchaeota archaeon]
MPHKRRKVRKKRGSRTHGYGQVGQHRKGSKGERKAGLHKEGWTYIVKHEPNYFGKKGFTSQKAIGGKPNVINVGELSELADKLAAEKKLKRKQKKIFLNLGKLGFHKLLGTGKITKPMLIKVNAHSETAAKKIEEAGGHIIQEES